MRYYKFLNEADGKIVSEHGHQEWEIGKEYSVEGTIEKCGNGFHASVEPLQALGYVKGTVIAVVEASGDSDNDEDKVCYRSMKIVKAYKWTALDSVALAIYSAEQVIKIYEDKYPEDSRPRDAIKAAKAYLKDPTKKNRDAGAARAAAGDAARAAARDAARAATWAAGAARDAARAARDAAWAAGDAARAAARDAARAAARDARAAAWAAGDAGDELTAKINRWMKARIKKLEEIV